ncbi:MAG TPA: hypothetical protein VMZ91_04335 [Candidatus Paceibacterota bacterium]|nr:hypothetical protein [Candidatus Paceibacterota bacterium]
MSKYSTYEVFEQNKSAKETGVLTFVTYEKARGYLCDRAMFLANVSSLRIFDIELILSRFYYDANNVVEHVEQLRNLKITSS